VTPLEAPHNDMHLAVGGFDVPGQPHFSPVAGANGDMGENDTAGLDPIFYFHHCFIDRQFWLWQVKQKSTEALEIIENYPGTNSVDSQGPTPGVAGGTWLTLDSPLQPFTKSGVGAGKVYYTSKDLVNIGKLGYAYDSPDDKNLLDPLPPATHATHSVRISGLNKNNIAGSHQLVVYGLFHGEKERRVLAIELVLSRWHTSGCQNCQTTSNVKRYAQLYGLPDGLNAAPGGGDSDDETLQVSVEVVTRAGSGPGRNDPPLKPVFSVVGRGEKYADFL
jgi:tyrosinase